MPRTPTVRALYKFVASTTWELARADYLNGETAWVVAERYDIGVSNLRQTFNRRGWTRRALAEARACAGPGGPPPQPQPQPAAAVGIAAAPPPGEGLFDTVLRRAREALTAGKGGEATALLKALRDYVVMVDDVSDAEEANSPIERALAGVIPEDIVRWRESMALVRLRQYWAPLDAHQEQWRDEARTLARAHKTAHDEEQAAAAKRAARKSARAAAGQRAAAGR